MPRLILLLVLGLGWPQNSLAQSARGDANADNAIDVMDVFYLTNHLFASGPPPLRACLADANDDQSVNTADIFLLIQYLFGGGTAPPPQPAEVCNSADDDCDGEIDEAGACPAPMVLSAEPLSATAVRITFSREVSPASVSADGSQFTFDNGLMAAAATVSGSTVTVTTNSQTAGIVYTVTVANTVTDVQGTPVGTPNTATFAGFVSPAVVRINELNANITGGCDLIELRVVSGGSMNGFRIQERTGTTGLSELTFTFPNFTVSTNDLIVVHMNSGSATCNPGNATQETTSPTDQPSFAFTGNYDTAYDFWSTDAGLVATDNVFTLFDANGTIVDALFASDDPAGTTTSAQTETAAATVGLANQWSPALASYPDQVFRTNAADDLNATGAVRTGTSMQRRDNTDDNDKADWTTGAGSPQTFGLPNVGQAPF